MIYLIIIHNIPSNFRLITPIFCFFMVHVMTDHRFNPPIINKLWNIIQKIYSMPLDNIILNYYRKYKINSFISTKYIWSAYTINYILNLLLLKNNSEGNIVTFMNNYVTWHTLINRKNVHVPLFRHNVIFTIWFHKLRSAFLCPFEFENVLTYENFNFLFNFHEV